MLKNVKIGDIEIPMMANGATEYRYRQMFGSDIMVTFFRAYQKMGEKFDLSNSDPELIGEMIDIASKLGFIMSKQAEKADMARITENEFIEWLEQFESVDILMSSTDIFGVWLSQRSQTVPSKNVKSRSTKGK